MKTRIITDMTWETFRDAVNDRSVCVIPMGSIELEGTHLPLGVDNFAADGLVRHLADISDILIGPTLPIGYSEWFNPFPGTLSLSHDTLTRVLSDYCRGLIRHGVRRLLFLNAHKGNNSAIEVVSRKLIDAMPISIGMINIWKLAGDLAAGRGLIAEGGFTHAGEIMTSVMMALRPDTVVKEKMTADKPRSPDDSEFDVKNSLGDVAFRGSVQTIYQDIHAITDTGTMGNPLPASAEKGQVIIDLMVDYIKAYLEVFKKIPVVQAAAG